ncbi:uncharacterized protein LOC121367549 [Gigantopelta aegis]|uniref:uncharacterized protein LOC121367549 n=1 Tax=Gigantopelta aegis TaxID=1735272 RepID=UPI001B88D364|nr:uncharacterized protein LOC121367549 [Gigantopelta aegis]
MDTSNPDYRLKTAQIHRIFYRPIKLDIRFEKVRIIDIDNARQEFRAEVQLSFRHKKPSGNYKKRTWDPLIYFPNCSTIHDTHKTLDYEKRGNMVSGTYTIDGTFIEIMELLDFPFDLQKLTIKVSSRRDCSEVEIIGHDSSQLSGRSTVEKASQGWLWHADFKTKVYLVETTDEKENSLEDNPNEKPGKMKKRNTIRRRRKSIKAMKLKQENAGKGKPNTDPEEMAKENINTRGQEIKNTAGRQCKITLYVVRKWRFYMWNIILITFLIMGLTFTSGTLANSQTGERLSVTLTLLLTSVAFKSSISDRLPVLSYLTLLDRYILACIFTQVGIAVQNAVSSFFRKPSLVAYGDTFDLISMLFIGLVTIAWNVYFINKARKVLKANQYTIRMVREEKENAKGAAADVTEKDPSDREAQHDDANHTGPGKQNSSNKNTETAIPKRNNKVRDQGTVSGTAVNNRENKSHHDRTSDHVVNIDN